MVSQQRRPVSHVEARAYTQLSINGHVNVQASDFVSILMRGTKANITGGKVTKIDISTPQLWCDYYELPVKDGVVTLYKAVRLDFKSAR
jgi:hypothetical protein